ncbi:MAG: prepilin-type N-terminal cleavage/methylation domain-containing protein [Verrucomicrobia bacterium]|nr:prepilin-type N-terminal cleavage/methylation domain-containing protein [Verrucomicrobiota bacterium]
MECKTIYTERGRRGFTLVEVLIALVVGMIVLAGVLSLTTFMVRSFAGLLNYADLEQQSRSALSRITEEVRRAQTLVSYEVDSVEFTGDDGINFEYRYVPDSERLIRISGGSQEVLLNDCEELEFNIYQRNAVSNSFDLYVASSPSTAKLFSVRWRCVKDVLGNILNTEISQSASIVIRNKQ